MLFLQVFYKNKIIELELEDVKLEVITNAFINKSYLLINDYLLNLETCYAIVITKQKTNQYIIVNDQIEIYIDNKLDIKQILQQLATTEEIKIETDYQTIIIDCDKIDYAYYKTSKKLERTNDTILDTNLSLHPINDSTNDDKQETETNK